jgi:hypothetical protein
MRKRLEFIRIGAGDDHRTALCGGGADQAVQIVARAGIDARGRFTLQKDTRITLHPAGEDHLLLIAA